MRWLLGVTLATAMTGCGLFPDTNQCDYSSICDGGNTIQHCETLCDGPNPDHPTNCRKHEWTTVCTLGEACVEHEDEISHTIAECVAPPAAVDASPLDAP